MSATDSAASGTESVPLLSTGEPSTLGVYRKLAAAFFGQDSPAVRWVDEQIADDPDGADGVVIAAESQMVLLFASLSRGPS